jgi:hypothetical protein
MQRSIDAGFLGVALFAFGYEDDKVWTSIEEINATLETIPADSADPTTTAVPTTTAAPSTTAAPTTTAATTVTPTSTAAATTTTSA